ncbi:hypothetical protein V8F33_005025 [Rhypophila sp. PSN 637]
MPHILQVIRHLFYFLLFLFFSGLYRLRLEKLLATVIRPKSLGQKHSYTTTYQVSIPSATHMETRVQPRETRNLPLGTVDRVTPAGLGSADTRPSEQDAFFAQSRAIFPVDFDDFPEEWSDESSENGDDDCVSWTVQTGLSTVFEFDSGSEFECIVYSLSGATSPADSSWAISVLSHPSTQDMGFEHSNFSSPPPSPGDVDLEDINHEDSGKHTSREQSLSNEYGGEGLVGKAEGNVACTPELENAQSGSP